MSITRDQVELKKCRTGLGLFAKERIGVGEHLEYSGELIRNDQPMKGRYLFRINSRWVIDGRNRDNIARYINHACQPNCVADVKKKRVLIMTLRDIEPGEELTLDYGPAYFEMFIKPKGCLCATCQGEVPVAAEVKAVTEPDESFGDLLQERLSPFVTRAVSMVDALPDQSAVTEQYLSYIRLELSHALMELDEHVRVLRGGS